MAPPAPPGTTPRVLTGISNATKNFLRSKWCNADFYAKGIYLQFRFSKKAIKIWQNIPLNLKFNIWCIKNRTNNSSKILLSLVWFFMHQTLLLVNVKSSGRFRQIVVAFLENLNFTSPALVFYYDHFTRGQRDLKDGYKTPMKMLPTNFKLKSSWIPYFLIYFPRKLFFFEFGNPKVTVHKDKAKGHST